MSIKVGVFFGGKSVEHEISIISALQAIQSLNKEKYEAIPIYITKNNEFYIGARIGDIDAYRGNIGALLKESQRVVLVNDGRSVKLLRYPQKAFSKPVAGEIDVAFPIVHGTNVEDGTLQGFFKMLNLPYVGCDVLSSALGMDKYAMKTVLKDNGIPVLDCRVFTASQFDRDGEALIASLEEAFSYPLIVKPVNLGSSIGISKAKDHVDLLDALETAFCYAQKVLVEPAVQHLKEINCAVLGDCDDAVPSECEEPVNADEILSFGDKYLGNGKTGAKKTGASKGMATLSRKIPADITASQKAAIQAYAVKAFRVLGCSGVSRIDFMMDTESGDIWLNEINTIPGSLSFYLWEPIGVPYSDLLERMIALALKRERESENVTYTFDSNVLQGASIGRGSKGTKGSKIK